MSIQAIRRISDSAVDLTSRTAMTGFKLNLVFLEGLITELWSPMSSMRSSAEILAHFSDLSSSNGIRSIDWNERKYIYNSIVYKIQTIQLSKFSALPNKWISMYVYIYENIGSFNMYVIKLKIKTTRYQVSLLRHVVIIFRIQSSKRWPRRKLLRGRFASMPTKRDTFWSGLKDLDGVLHTFLHINF